MFTGDTGSYHFMGIKISFPYTTESPVQGTKKPRKNACWISHSLIVVMYKRGVCVCVKGCSLLESCQLSETTVGG